MEAADLRHTEAQEAAPTVSEPIHPEIQAQLQGLWAAVQAGGRPELVLLEGAAGLGKSHLARALSDHAARDPQAAVALAAPGGLIGTLLLALPELLSSRDPAFLAAARPHLNRDWPATVPPPAGPSDPAATLARAVAGAVGRARPLLLIAEDLHDQPQGARAFLNTLWTRLLLDERPALLLLTTRPLAEYPDAARSAEELGRSAQLARAASGSEVTALTLAPLADGSLEVLLRAALGGDPPPGLLEWLRDHAECHPLRSAELLRVLRERGALSRHEHHWQFCPPPAGSLPGSLGAVLRERLRPVQAARTPWAALSALAVLDVPTPEPAWRAVAGLGHEAFAQARDWLLHRDLVRLHGAGQPAEYTCAHPLYPPLVRAELDWGVLETLHARAAQADLDVLARARHARLAALPEARALTEQALALAQQRAAPHEVIREARALLEMAPAHAAAQAALVAALDALGHWNEVLTETAQDPATLPLTQLAFRAQALAERGQLPQALAAARLGLARAGELAPAPHLMLEDVLYRTLLHQGHLDEAEAGLTSALAGSLDPLRRMHLLDILARLHQRRGDYHLCLHLSREAAALIAGQPPADGVSAGRHWRALMSAGSSAIHMSLWAEAETHLRAAHDLIVRQGHVASLMVVEGNVAYLQLMQGDYPSAEAGTWRQYHRAVASGNARVEAALLWNLGICRLWRGDPGEALTLMQRSCEIWPSVGAANPSDFAEALALAGRLDEARAQLALPDHDFYPDHPNSRARVHLLLGDPAAALGEVARLRPDDGAGLQARAALIRAQAQLVRGDPGQAGTELTVALAHAQAAQHRSVLAEWHLTRAVWQVRQDEDGAAAWQTGLAGVQAVDGQGHLMFVRGCFPQAAAALDARPAAAVPAAQTRLRLLGTVAVEQPGGVRPWRARKVKELLGLLVCAHYGEGHPAALTRERLTLALWPDADEASAEASFRKTLTRLREALGGAATLTRTAYGYALAGVQADLDDFLAALHAGQDAQAAAAYAGPFLGDLDLPAAGELRDALHARWREVTLRLTYHDPQGGLPHLRRLLAHDPLDVAATRALLDAHERLGEPETRAGALRRAQTLFHAALGEIPPELTAVAG
ncbi:AAA family ATPase [Deinococcus sp. HMF7620]|uniref:AAA family ATPase n=1 Tax=Deinococcus arboris TaxID=2682977 RepID=A0A7C9HZM7_9DEIO|nr:AAA family ATPase [Deinococcus arboris]